MGTYAFQEVVFLFLMKTLMGLYRLWYVRFCHWAIDVGEKLKDFFGVLVLGLGIICFITRNVHNDNLEIVLLLTFTPFVVAGVLLGRRSRREAIIERLTSG
jgi:hypothetical protein